MNNEMKHVLTHEEIEAEVEKIGDFFSQIPNDLKAEAAEHFIFEIVNWGSHDYYQALGIFEEAKRRYCEVSIQVMNEEDKEKG